MRIKKNARNYLPCEAVNYFLSDVLLDSFGVVRICQFQMADYQNFQLFHRSWNCSKLLLETLATSKISFYFGYDFLLKHAPFSR